VEEVYRLAQRQHGVVSRTQLNMTPAALRQEISSGRWFRVARNVYRINGAPTTWKSRMMAAVLTAGPGAVLSHRSAAALWGLEGFGPPDWPDITVPLERRPRLKRTRLHRSSDLAVAGVTRKDGIPVTGLARTVLDLCAVHRVEGIPLRALDDADRRKLVTWPELWECLVLHTRRGRPGVAGFRRLLELRNGKTPPGTTFAGLVQTLLVDAGLPEPEPEYPWASYFLDLAYPDVKVAMECDGKAGHLNARSFEEDPVRNNALLLDGWIVLHVTWRRLIDHPDHIVDDVGRALAQRYADQSSGLSSVY
jgi:hypothetical protein